MHFADILASYPDHMDLLPRGLGMKLAGDHAVRDIIIWHAEVR